MHLWMETYLFYCSVRLGVIVVATLTFLQLIVPAVLFLAVGAKVFDPLVHVFESDDHYNKVFIVKKFLGWLDNYPANFLLVLNIFLFLHIALCALAVYGAIRLLKWFLLPFIVAELVRVVLCLTCHIVLMIVLKKILNLGVLIAVTLAGGFAILYLGYNWAASVALFQIIELIHSERYRALYGDDPFASSDALASDASPPFAYGTVENVRVLVTPNADEVHEQKHLNAFAKGRGGGGGGAGGQPIIAVIPFQQYGPDRGPRQPVLAWQAETEQPRQRYSPHDTATPDFGNWQWAELLGGARRQRSNLIGRGAQWH